MSSRRKPFEIGEHVQLGLTLAAMRDELTSMYVWLGNERLPKSHAVVRDIDNAIKRIDRARSNLENEMFAADREHASTDVYYPSRQARERAADGAA